MLIDSQYLKKVMSCQAASKRGLLVWQSVIKGVQKQVLQMGREMASHHRSYSIPLCSPIVFAAQRGTPVHVRHRSKNWRLWWSPTELSWRWTGLLTPAPVASSAPWSSAAPSVCRLHPVWTGCLERGPLLRMQFSEGWSPSPSRSRSGGLWWHRSWGLSPTQWLPLRWWCSLSSGPHPLSHCSGPAILPRLEMKTIAAPTGKQYNPNEACQPSKYRGHPSQERGFQVLLGLRPLILFSGFAFIGPSVLMSFGVIRFLLNFLHYLLNFDQFLQLSSVLMDFHYFSVLSRTK